jgi:succinate dehydrogenase / fumarate reductase flavoprotein subunit
MNRQINFGKVKLYTRREMLDVVVIDGIAKGIVCRNLLTGEIEKYSAHAVILATGGYSNVFFLSTNAMNCNTTAIWRAHKRGAPFANPCYTQIHPTCLPVHGEGQSKLTLMSESLRNDGRIWVSKLKNDMRKPEDIPEDERDYYLERKYPTYGNLSPRDISSRAAKEAVDDGRGAQGKDAVYLDFNEAINRLGKNVIEERYGNLCEIYQTITGENPYETPMKIYPAPHYVMGGLWVDYNLMSTIPGLFVAGEANFSDHGANRLGASALMQGLADGYFVLPYTIGNYLGGDKPTRIKTDHSEFSKVQKEVEGLTAKLLSIKGKRTVDDIHKQLGRIMWNNVGMARNEKGLNEAIKEISELRSEFWENVNVVGGSGDVNQCLERAGRLADYLELGELIALDALDRKESCGGHFREEYQTPEGEALRNDNDYAYVGAWEFRETGKWELNKEHLEFESVHLATRSYK